MRERADFGQDEVATLLNTGTEFVRRIERLDEVDLVTAERYERAVAFLRGLRLRVARKVARAAREAAAV